MVFSSTVFLFIFLPITVIGNLAIKNKYRKFWLVLCSLFFYAWSQPQFLWLVISIIFIDYICAILIERAVHKRLVLVFAIILNILGLLYFKYTNFILEIINSAAHNNIQLLNIILPIGISFYTFKGISYIADVYMNKIEPERNIINLSTYIIMFPEIMSGPIDSYKTIKPAILENHITSASFQDGIKRLIFGLAQKMIIANTLGIIVDDIWSKGAGAISWKLAWLCSIAYTLQIYFDFAGYSNMAIGIGKMLGFKFSENFNLPYVSKSITEFWRRWHITLGEWFKKYVYIPLGGNRKTAVRGYINLIIVFLLTGIWHGASWTFIVWGCPHGLFRIIEKGLQSSNISINIPQIIKNVFGHIYLLFLVNLCWVLFRAPDLKSAIDFIQAMFGKLSAPFCGISVREYLDGWNVFVLLLAIVFSTSLPKLTIQRVKQHLNSRIYLIAKDVALFILFLLSIMEVVTNTYNTFIYFQF